MSSEGREVAKAVLYGISSVLVAPCLLSFRVRARLMGSDRALEGSSQALSLIPGVTGQYLRRAFYSRVLARCHRSVTIEFGTLLSKVSASIDENVYIGPRCHLGLVHIERDVLIGPGVQVPSGRVTHGTGDLSRPIREQEGVKTLVRIGAGSWLGGGAIVMADIGRETVLGAGAVVTAPLPDRVVAGGVPARVIRHRDA
jgi:virginiamycin A acetyltransferase